VAVLLPQTSRNDAGSSVGPARGAFKVGLDHVLVLHDEIDLPFGRIQLRTGGGVAGHNGLKSVRQGLGSAEFARLRVGVGRPDSTDPQVVSAWVLGRFRESREEVQSVLNEAADAAERLVLGAQTPA
jgi:PTH1 family peptidyl-tRNA hydrolase